MKRTEEQNPSSSEFSNTGKAGKTFEDFSGFYLVLGAWSLVLPAIVERDEIVGTVRGTPDYFAMTWPWAEAAGVSSMLAGTGLGVTYLVKRSM